MRFQQFQFHTSQFRSIPWYWSVALGLIAAILVGLLSIAALAGVVVIGTAYAVYRISSMVRNLFRRLNGEEPQSSQELLVRNYEAKQRAQSRIEVIDIEAEQLPRRGED